MKAKDHYALKQKQTSKISHAYLKSVQCLCKLKKSHLYQTGSSLVKLKNRIRKLSTYFITKCKRTPSCRNLQCRKTKTQLQVIYHNYGIKGSSGYIQINMNTINLRDRLTPSAIFKRMVL